MAELRVLGRKAHLDVAQALAVGKLDKGNDPEMVCAVERPNTLVVAMARDATGDCCPRQEIHELGEERLVGINGGLRAEARTTARIGARSSNRHYHSSLERPRQSCHGFHGLDHSFDQTTVKAAFS